MPDNLQAFEIDYKDVEKKYDKFNKDIADAFGADSVEAFKKTGDLDFEQLISKFKIAGVDFIEVNQIRKFAIAKHENYIQYPERRYAIVQDEKGKVKFYEINFPYSLSTNFLSKGTPCSNQSQIYFTFINMKEGDTE